MERTKTVFKIGPSVFAVEADWPLEWNPDVAKFIAEDASEEVCYKLKKTEELLLPQGNCILHREEVDVWMEAGEEVRVYTIPGDRQPYAVKRGDTIWYAGHYAPFLQENKVLFSLLALERQCLLKDSMILHSAYVRYQGKGILFTAPSGTGKSTQGDLWKQHRKAEVINGDRSLLYRENGRWMVGGWPFSGSSTFCENISSEIRAIVYLSQQKENVIRRGTKTEAVKKLISEITVNFWNAEFVNKALDLITSAAEQVPFYCLGCTPQEDAVACLEERLKEDEDER